MAKLISAFRRLIAFLTGSNFGQAENNQLIEASLMPIDLAVIQIEQAA